MKFLFTQALSPPPSHSLGTNRGIAMAVAKERVKAGQGFWLVEIQGPTYTTKGGCKPSTNAGCWNRWHFVGPYTYTIHILQ
jgi:hypothetical protein